jgi:hypothetical protein
MSDKEIKALCYNRMDKFATKLENEMDLIGNVAISAVFTFDVKNPHAVMFC